MYTKIWRPEKGEEKILLMLIHNYPGRKCSQLQYARNLRSEGLLPFNRVFI